MTKGPILNVNVINLVPPTTDAPLPKGSQMLPLLSGEVPMAGEAAPLDFCLLTLLSLDRGALSWWGRGRVCGEALTVKRTGGERGGRAKPVKLVLSCRCSLLLLRPPPTSLCPGRVDCDNRRRALCAPMGEVSSPLDLLWRGPEKGEGGLGGGEVGGGTAVALVLLPCRSVCSLAQLPVGVGGRAAMALDRALMEGVGGEEEVGRGPTSGKVGQEAIDRVRGAGCLA